MQAGTGLRIDYYTDPLCCWSWAFEPVRLRLRAEFGDRLPWRYFMGGLIADWETFHDPINAIHRPAQMAPHWYQMRQMTGLPIDERLWIEDPPASSYPACIAFKAAARQGVESGERYLRRLREAAMQERRNIALREELLALAEEVAGSVPDSLDTERFRADLDSPETLEAFREDLKEARYRGIGRFPTLILRRETGPGILLVGCRPYAVLRDAIAHLAPDLHPVCPVPRSPSSLAGRETEAGPAAVSETAA